MKNMMYFMRLSEIRLIIYLIISGFPLQITVIMLKALKWHKVQLMEEVQSPLNRTEQQWMGAAYAICKQITCQAAKLQGHSSGKTFFVSIAHQFLERLIHLHSPEVKRALVIQAKQLERIRNLQVSADFISLMEEFKKLSDIKLEKESLLAQINKLFAHLVFYQCQGKTSLDIQNIFLEINCSFNYACPLCIKQINSNQPKSIKLIKNYSEQPETLIYPRTMKAISLKEHDQSQRLPRIQKPSRLESILDSMKAERTALKRQEETKQRKINKIWNMLDHLMQLDRQKFIVDHIFNQNEGKENRLLKELLQKNVKNKHHISHFCNKKRHNLMDPMPSKTIENMQQVVEEKLCHIQRKALRSVSPKYAHRKLSTKKHVKILEPINSNTTSVDLCAKTIHEEGTIELAPNIKTVKVVFIGQSQTLRANCRQTKNNYYHRSFKSSRDVLATVDGSEFADYSERSAVNKSLKII